MKTLGLALFAVVPALFLSGCMMMHGSHGRPPKAICPVSGTTVKVKADTPSMTWKGRQLYFASEEHLKRFASAPDSFKTPEQAPASGSHEGH
jgi:YHS domain-containing protein